MFMPFNILWMWLRGLLSLAFLAGGITLLTLWFNNREQVVTEPAAEANGDSGLRTRVEHWEFGWNRETAYLVGGLVLTIWTFTGGWWLSPRLFRRREEAGPAEITGGGFERIKRPDGTELAVRTFGPEQGDPVVFIHGWGLDSNEWCYTVRELPQHRIIIWDLPGLGHSSSPHNSDWSLEKMAGDLDAVLTLAGNKPAVLVGHSIGGMIILTWCKQFAKAINTRVRAIVITHSTYTNPVKTCSTPGLATALQKPLLEPLCHLTVWLSPLARVMNWLSYLNGSAHWSTEFGSFSGRESSQQLEFMTRYYCQAAPHVVARGMLAMFRYDATDALSRINLPALIVAADRDSTCVPQASQYMAGTIPGARYITLGDGKHCALFEKHHEFHAAVANFIGALPTEPSASLPLRSEPVEQHSASS